MWLGSLAHLGERPHGMREVTGSTPVGSTWAWAREVTRARSGDRASLDGCHPSGGPRPEIFASLFQW